MSRYVWAVDPGLNRLAFAFADMSSEDVQVETLLCRTAERDGARLGLLDRQVRAYAARSTDRYPPVVVWVEQASGRFANLQLTYAVGVLQAALYETLQVPTWTLPSSAWKRCAVGAGNATKAQVREWVDGLGVAVANQDEADAVAIACAGRAMLRNGSWEAVA